MNHAQSLHTPRNNTLIIQNRRGAMSVLIAVTLPVLLAMAAFAIQFAYIDLGRVELRVATDAAAEAAARELSESGDVVAARAAAKIRRIETTMSQVSRRCLRIPILSLDS